MALFSNFYVKLLLSAVVGLGIFYTGAFIKYKLEKYAFEKENKAEEKRRKENKDDPSSYHIDID